MQALASSNKKVLNTSGQVPIKDYLRKGATNEAGKDYFHRIMSSFEYRAHLSECGDMPANQAR
jgi:hypothetical protein